MVKTVATMALAGLLALGSQAATAQSSGAEKGPNETQGAGAFGAPSPERTPNGGSGDKGTHAGKEPGKQDTGGAENH